MSWQDDAPCKGMMPVFFSTNPADWKAARKVCATCPHTAPCLEAAMADQFTVGIWAGTSQSQRKVLRRTGEAKRRKALIAACGTNSGYYRHLRATVREEPCQPCRDAHARVERERGARRSAA